MRYLASLLLLIIPSAFGASPEVIYGEDNRLDYYAVSDPQLKKLADSTVALVRAANVRPNGEWTDLVTSPYGPQLALCPSEPFYHQETLAFCSGFLVAPDIVATAGHCLRTNESCLNTRFVFGFRIESPEELPRSVRSENVFNCKQLLHSIPDPKGEDFALVRLDRPVTHVEPLAYRTSGRLSVGDSLMVMGHPSGLPLKIAGGANVREMKSEYLVANLDTYGGNSGSAVFNSVTGQVEGILVRGNFDFALKDGCRVSIRCEDDGCRGEDVTLFERVLPVLNRYLRH